MLMKSSFIRDMRGVEMLDVQFGGKTTETRHDARKIGKAVNLPDR